MSPGERVRSVDWRGPVLTWGSLAVVYVVWGSTYFFIKIGIETIPPLMMAAGRFLVAGGVLFAFSIRSNRRPGDRVGGPQWIAALIAGGLLFVGGNGGVTLGEASLPSGTVALMVATVPLWMTLLGALFLHEPLRRWTVVGVGIGLAGVALLARPGGSSFHPLATLAVLGSPIAWASGSLYSRRAPLPSRIGVATAMEMLAGGALLALLSLVTGEAGRAHLNHVSRASLLSVAYLVVFGSLLAFSAYNLVLRRLPTSVVATYAYVNPAVAVVLGAAFLAEPVTPRLLVAGAAILVAVGLILSTSSRRSAGHRVAPPAALPEAVAAR
ncbi:MAG: EamA family transporter [Candidatus Dormibacteria bacterium]